MSKPIASDWVRISTRGIEFSPELNRYWFEGRVYDETSARHNGLIGAGAMLHETLAFSNSLRKGAAR